MTILQNNPKMQKAMCYEKTAETLINCIKRGKCPPITTTSGCCWMYLNRWAEWAEWAEWAKEWRAGRPACQVQSPRPRPQWLLVYSATDPNTDRRRSSDLLIPPPHTHTSLYSSPLRYFFSVVSLMSFSIVCFLGVFLMIFHLYEVGYNNQPTESQSLKHSCLLQLSCELNALGIK